MHLTQLSGRGAVPPVPLFSSAVKRQSQGTTSVASAVAALLEGAEKENSPALVVPFSPARVDARFKDAFKVNEAAVARSLEHRDSSLDTTVDEDEAQRSGGAGATAMGTMSLRRKRRHDSDSMEEQQQEDEEAVVPTAIVHDSPASGPRAPRPSKSSRKGRSRRSVEAAVKAE